MPNTADAIDEAFSWLRTVDAVFSTYKDDSEISRLNRGELAVAELMRAIVQARCAGVAVKARE